MEGLSPLHLILVLAIALLVIGPGRLPETGAAIGRAVRGFRDAMEGREASSDVPSGEAAAPAASSLPATSTSAQTTGSPDDAAGPARTSTEPTPPPVTPGPAAGATPPAESAPVPPEPASEGDDVTPGS